MYLDSSSKYHFESKNWKYRIDVQELIEDLKWLISTIMATLICMNYIVYNL